MKKTECQELGWTKEHENDGFYNEEGRLVQRFAGIGISSDVIPHDACFLRVSYIPDNLDEMCVHTLGDVKLSKTGQWVVFFTHPSLPEVEEGGKGPIIACVKK